MPVFVTINTTGRNVCIQKLECKIEENYQFLKENVILKHFFFSGNLILISFKPNKTYHNFFQDSTMLFADQSAVILLS